MPRGLGPCAALAGVRIPSTWPRMLLYPWLKYKARLYLASVTVCKGGRFNTCQAFRLVPFLSTSMKVLQGPGSGHVTPLQALSRCSEASATVHILRWPTHSRRSQSPVLPGPGGSHSITGAGPGGYLRKVETKQSRTTGLSTTSSSRQRVRPHGPAPQAGACPMARFQLVCSRPECQKDSGTQNDHCSRSLLQLLCPELVSPSSPLVSSSSSSLTSDGSATVASTSRSA